MGAVKEFKEFAVKGNVVDMAVGIIIGIAFGRVVQSLVNDIIMPPVGMAIGGVDFSNLAIVLKQATEEAEAVTIAYGAFIQTLIDFLIVALAIFVAVKVINSLKRKEEEKPATPLAINEELLVLREIRDELKKG
ncbi:large-conductance mechanosensitive channel protein MscL [Wenzhouxiangella sp. XN201]|uniref:large-conductance mechanosensitive channel protein MscL n=1 Tax=Wenzhouxiangella sp. XN201 TaxID=2710755 RepID=UPI0013C9956C|nr:large-conductance mechanosensitive channel protein MscL [Wenzhouxiangella sp. XN201]NEZ04278.1 large-conductance mechanosensitive channel protein MscL [Wenzhouxiangella sp. XN201]